MSILDECFELLESLDSGEYPVVLKDCFDIKLLRVECSHIINIRTSKLEVVVNVKVSEEQYLVLLIWS
jgi:hypothetical protein